MPSRKPSIRMSVPQISEADLQAFIRPDTNAASNASSLPSTPPAPKGRTGGVKVGDRDLVRFAVYLGPDDAERVSVWCKRNYTSVSSFAVRAMLEKLGRGET